MLVVDIETKQESAEGASALEEQVISLNRTSKVVKGGRSFHMGALVAVGDRKGNVGIGHGKANEVPQAITKGSQAARKEMMRVSLKEQRTLPHTVIGEFGGAQVLMKPASEGTGIIAGAGVRIILELCGVHDVLTKSLGSSNPVNVAKATMRALANLHSPDEIDAKRQLVGVSPDQ